MSEDVKITLTDYCESCSNKVKVDAEQIKLTIKKLNHTKIGTTYFI